MAKNIQDHVETDNNGRCYKNSANIDNSSLTEATEKKMTETTILPKLSIDSLPAPKTIKTNGVISKINRKEVANGYVQVEVVLSYMNEANEQDEFYARWNVRPEWFTPEYTQKYRDGKVTDAEKTQYDINFIGLTRNLCMAAGLTEIDLDAAVGQVVGFKTKAPRDGSPFPVISYFFKPRK